MMNQRSLARAAFAAALAVTFLGACSEQPQTSGTTHGSDTQPWHGAQPAYGTSGWTAGDKASWQAQLKQRTINQNEYVRLSP